MKLLLIFAILLQATYSSAQKTKKENNKVPSLITHSTKTDIEITKALQMVNSCRRDAGLDTVTLSDALSSRCDKHARYLVLNKNDPKIAGLKAHHEEKDMPGYSDDGNAAGYSSDIFEGTSPDDAVQGFIMSFYHRIPLLQPNLKSIGIGYYTDDSRNSATVLDCLSGAVGKSEIGVVFYPADKQKNVPLVIQTEIPDPVKSGNDAGFPITIYFAQYQVIDSVTFRLSDKFHSKIPCEVSCPKQPATSFSQWNTVCAIPVHRLVDNRQYHVSFSCIVNGKPFSKEYDFYTTWYFEQELIQHLSPLSEYSIKWNTSENLICNTAANADYLTDQEKRVIYILNLARKNPRLFAETVLDQYSGMAGKEKMKSSTYYQSLVENMSGMEAAGLLYPDSLCYASALCHASISGSMGYEGHIRVKQDCKRKQHFMGECCDYGNNEALDIVIDLLIDEDIPDVGHRLICLDKAYKKLGVSIQPHKKFDFTAVLDFY